MIDELKPYPALKDTGVPWLGKVPEHWKVLPLCAIATPRQQINEQERKLLSVYLGRGVVPFSSVDEKRTNPTSEDLSKYQAVEPGDFVLNNQQAWRGSVGVSHFKGIVSPAYLVLALDGRLERQFADRLLSGRQMVTQYLLSSKGVGSIQRNLYWPHLRRVLVLVPPTAEQTAIARFLDHADRRIRRYMRAKRKLIELLEEQKQAIIHRAVTRGLDLNVRLKPSGVEWLGDVPEHWEVWPLCAIARPRKETNQPHRELLSVYLGRGVIPFSAVGEKRTNPTSEDLSKYQVVEPGDFVLNNQQAWRGSVGLSRHQGIVSPAYLVLALDGRLLVEFAERLLPGRAMVAQYLVSSKGVGSIQRNLYWPHLRRVAVLVPPVVEQVAIARYLDDATVSVESTIERAGREFNLLREFRVRLIADVVTGKLDVREAAARLPDEVDEAEPLDEIDAESDAETDDSAEVPEEADA